MNIATRGTKNRLMPFYRWLSAVDPGMIRLQAAGRAALALLSIWLLLRYAADLLFEGPRPPLPLFGVLIGINFLLFIIDLKPADRLLSLWLAPIPFAGAALLASSLAGYFWLSNGILLSLFFFAYFFRRYGTRAGELSLLATVGYYYGFLLHLPSSLYLPFVAIVAVSVFIVYLWQFLILPYDPTRLLLRGVTALYNNVAHTVVTVRDGLEPSHTDPRYEKTLRRQLKRVRQNRRIIEGLFAAIVSPALWSQDRLNRLQVELFKTEQGLELLVEAAVDLDRRLNELPGDVRELLIEGLGILEADLWEMASNHQQSRLSDIGEWLKSKIRSTLEAEPPAQWVVPVLRIGVASGQLARSVTNLHDIQVAWKESGENLAARQAPKLQPIKPFGSLGKKSGFVLHPTSILGLQAVIATGLAMLAALLLKMDQPNLVYWTAFTVIAGSSGESLRRITMRVMGVIGGTVIGVLLAVLLPDGLVVSVLVITACFFLMTYMIPASYTWMVFWLNIAVLMIITTLGGAALDLLFLRPVSTLLGAAIAALVVIFVLPIHVQDRFTAALSAFLTQVDRYIEVYVNILVGNQTSGDLKAEELNIDASYRKLEQNLPGVMYEYNPLSRAQNRLADQATTLAALSSYVTRLNDDIGAGTGSLAGVPGNELVCDLQAQIHQAIAALNGLIAKRQGEETQLPAELNGWAAREVLVEDLLAAEAGSAEAVRNRALYHLKRIHNTVLQIASGLGMPVTLNGIQFTGGGPVL